ncbi:hypothetical protein [Bacillus sp. 166amftsu]|uniref:hypothetical protein n=1 Tax=Bacillus sp. 166amftsu TaxID=1761753 RepID=UPI00089A42F9|nr:hypothetical protein [Bacillus sp. 166amftsu]SDZ43482.1 hypothetical protein SAMN04488156_13816 [Bacillus sp. 166amftsu]
MKLNTKKMQFLTKEETEKIEGGGWNWRPLPTGISYKRDYSKAGKVDSSYKHGSPWGKW